MIHPVCSATALLIAVLIPSLECHHLAQRKVHTYEIAHLVKARPRAPIGRVERKEQLV
jgi:hypothetical protein